jgi:hypothetical protein
MIETKNLYRAGITALALILAACNNLAGSLPGGRIPEGMGLARISLGGDNARTLTPGITGLYFTLGFTAPGKTQVNETLTGDTAITVPLEPAVWTLEVKGYTDSGMGALKVRGTGSVPVTSGAASDCTVYLTADFDSTGDLTYNFSFPASARGRFILYPLDASGTSREIDISSVGGTASDTLTGLPGGAYLAAVDLYDGGSNKATTWTVAVHIGGVVTASLVRDFTFDDFAECAPVVGGSENTLAAKLDAALNSPAGSYTITLDGLETDLAAFTPKILTVTENKDITVTLRGNGNTVQLGSDGRLFTLGAGFGSNLTLVLQDITLAGRSANNGSLIRIESGGTLEMRAGSFITGNTSSSEGGGVYVFNNGTLIISGGAISGNTAASSGATSYGGGVYVNGGTVNINGGVVSGNTVTSSSDSYGGGVYVNGGTLNMSGGAVSGNTVTFSYSSSVSYIHCGGGGVYVNGGTLNISGGAVSDNTAAPVVPLSSPSSDFSPNFLVYGGGVYVNNGTLNISGGAMSGNTAAVSVASSFNNFTVSRIYGGGVYLDGGTFTMSGGMVHGNSASASSHSFAHTYGGGVYVSGGAFTMSSGTVSNNTATSTVTNNVADAYGGGVYVSGGGGTFTMSSGTVSNNTATSATSSSSTSSAVYAYGGGVYSYGIFTLSGGAVSGNTATASSSDSSSHASGGGVSLDYSGTFTMSGGAVSGNTASSSYIGSSFGGGVSVDWYGIFTMSGGVVSGNTASSAHSYSSGGGVYVRGESSSSSAAFTMSGGTVSGNTAFSSLSNSEGGGVSVYQYGVFTMNGGTVRDNIVSKPDNLIGTGTYGKEVLVSSGTFKMSGDARPERVLFPNSYNAYITITGPLNGGTVPIDLGVTVSEPLAYSAGTQILRLDNSYSSGDLAVLKTRFTLGDTVLMESPYTETPIPAGYTMGSNGKLLPPPSSGINGITYSSVSGGAWTLESDGRRKSPAISNNSTTKARVSFTSAVPDAIITIALDVSSGYYNFNYAFISALDNASSTYNSDYYSNSRISGTESVTVAIPVSIPGNHFIDIGYRKDDSYSEGSGYAWFKVVE